jgi:hypothetical protein
MHNSRGFWHTRNEHLAASRTLKDLPFHDMHMVEELVAQGWKRVVAVNEISIQLKLAWYAVLIASYSASSQPS